MSSVRAANIENWARAIGFSAFLVGTTIALSASAAVPATMVMKVLRFGLSTSPTCENMTIYSIDTPVSADFTNSPTLGTAAVPLGTYNCVALEIEPFMSVTPKAPEGACTGEKLTFDYCALLDGNSTTQSTESQPTPSASGTEARPDAGETRDREPPAPPGDADVPGMDETPAPFDGILPLGGPASSAFTKCKPGGQPFVVYLTTQETVRYPNVLRPPSSASDKMHGQHLGAPLVVGPNTTGTLLVGFQMEDQNGHCGSRAPTFEFATTATQ